MLRNLVLLSLFTHLGSLAATQTAYGESFSAMRWYSLFAFFGLGCLQWVGSHKRVLLSSSIYLRLAIYISLWGLTVITAENQLFSGLRWTGHVMIVVASLMFLPCALRTDDAWKLFLAMKLIIAVALGFSYFYPAELNVFDDPSLYRGIFGNPNALGHTAAVGLLLFLHGFITTRNSNVARLQGAIAVLAAILLIQSGARSSIMAFLAGFFALYVFYRTQLSKYALLAAIAAALALLLMPNFWEGMQRLVFKHADGMGSGELTDRLLFSRQMAWEQHWDGFIERPILGWGFGVDKNSDFSDWQGDWGSSAVTGRDPVNDIMYALESGGVVGLLAYLSLIALLIKAWFSPRMRAKVDFQLSQDGFNFMSQSYDSYRAFFCLAILLIVMFQMDNTSFAVGNFFAALLWISMGLALGYYSLIGSLLQQSSSEPLGTGALSRPRIS